MNTTTRLLNAAFFVVRKIFCLHRSREQTITVVTAEMLLNVYHDESGCPGAGKHIDVQKLANIVLCTFSTSTSVSYHLKQENKIVSMFNCLVKLPVIPTCHGIVPLGKHALQSKFKNMCSEAETIGNKTNHSLCANAVTEFFRCGVPEKHLQETLFCRKHYVHVKDLMKCSIMQYQRYSPKSFFMLHYCKQLHSKMDAT